MKRRGVALDTSGIANRDPRPAEQAELKAGLDTLAADMRNWVQSNAEAQGIFPSVNLAPGEFVGYVSDTAGRLLDATKLLPGSVVPVVWGAESGQVPIGTAKIVESSAGRVYARGSFNAESDTARRLRSFAKNGGKLYIVWLKATQAIALDMFGIGANEEAVARVN